jgi:CBS domain-containing protein
VLSGAALELPIGDVMVHPVHTLTHLHTPEDAVLLISRHGIRHVPVTRDGAVAGMVSSQASSPP